MQKVWIGIIAVSVAGLISWQRSKKSPRRWFVDSFVNLAYDYQNLLIWAFFIGFSLSSTANYRIRFNLQAVSTLPLLIVLCIQFYQSRQRKRRILEADRKRGGLCVVCGYDLRQSLERCPECGTPVPLLLMLHNDDNNDLPGVVAALAAIAGLETKAAETLAKKAHLEGQAEILETDLARAMELRRELQARGLTVSIKSRADLLHAAPAAPITGST